MEDEEKDFFDLIDEEYEELVHDRLINGIHKNSSLKQVFDFKMKLKSDFLEVMPMNKWLYCHELLINKDGVCCDWVFKQFLYEFEHYSLCQKEILELNCFNKNEKRKLIKLIKKLQTNKNEKLKKYIQ